MKKISQLLVIILLTIFLWPPLSRAETPNQSPAIFKAVVMEILQVEQKTREDGSVFAQQNLKLLGLEGEWKNREVIYQGLDDIEVANIGLYKVGDRVFMDAYTDESGATIFYITDFVRSGQLFLLFTLFILTALLIGRYKGFKALISLAISFVIIIKFILPQILNGRDPFLISLVGGLVILAVVIYLTEGVQKKSHLAVASVLISLSITLILSLIFTNLTKLSGLAQEEAAFLIGLGNVTINFKGLLLAGFIIGAIGVLDDIIIGQIETVEQIKAANPSLPPKKIFSLAYKVGNTHLGAIINTLFLAYAGAALPLLLLFILNQESGLTFGRLINTEIVSTEIVRTLVGGIGVMLSMPVATFLATVKLRKKSG
jgi:uncharacterized membrane protein